VHAKCEAAAVVVALEEVAEAAVVVEGEAGEVVEVTSVSSSPIYRNHAAGRT
jgi:hypothetical protein